MFAGLIAALLAAAFAHVVAEPQIDRAIAWDAAHRAAGVADGSELVGRAVQRTAGLFTAITLYGVGVGGLFAMAWAFAYGRIGRIGPRTLALMLGVIAFVVIVLAPAIKYPPTPPAIGGRGTAALRAAAFFGMIGLSMVGAAIAGLAWRALARRLTPIDALAAAIDCYAVLTAIGAALLPAVDGVPKDFDASLLWDFRIASLGVQGLFWITLGWLFGRLALPVLGDLTD